MGIRYRTATETGGTAREGQVESIAELEALVTLGSLSPRDEVALDGVKYQRAEKVPALRGAFREKSAGAGDSAVGDVFLFLALAVLGFAAFGLFVKVAALAVKLAVLAGIGLGAVWLVRKLLR